MYKYKLKEGVQEADYMIPGVGVMKDGKIESRFPLSSPILELVSSSESNPSPLHVTGVAPQAAQPVIDQQQTTVQHSPESNTEQ